MGLAGFSVSTLADTARSRTGLYELGHVRSQGRKRGRGVQKWRESVEILSSAP